MASTVTSDNDMPNTRIVYPNVPAQEADPRIRIKTMVKIFNRSLRSDRDLDRGFFHEIVTAKHLVEANWITHGKQISRPLTRAERDSGLYKGHSQMIIVPMEDGLFRELDMVYMYGRATHIVEAKNMKTVDTHQLEANVRLAAALLGENRVVYALPGQKTGHEKALRAAYATLHPDFRLLVELDVLNIADQICDLAQDPLRPDRPAPLPKSFHRNLQADFNLRTVDSEFDVFDNYSDISADNDSEDDIEVTQSLQRSIAEMSGVPIRNMNGQPVTKRVGRTQN